MCDLLACSILKVHIHLNNRQQICFSHKVPHAFLSPFSLWSILWSRGEHIGRGCPDSDQQADGSLRFDRAHAERRGGPLSRRGNRILCIKMLSGLQGPARSHHHIRPQRLLSSLMITSVKPDGFRKRTLQRLSS